MAKHGSKDKGTEAVYLGVVSPLAPRGPGRLSRVSVSRVRPPAPRWRRATPSTAARQITTSGTCGQRRAGGGARCPGGYSCILFSSLSFLPTYTVRKLRVSFKLYDLIAVSVLQKINNEKRLLSTFSAAIRLRTVLGRREGRALGTFGKHL